MKTDLLRRKLMLMSKSHQELISVCSQDFRKLTNTLRSGSGSTDNSTASGGVDSLLCQQQQQQRVEIEMHKQELECFKTSYSKLLARHNDLAIELGASKRALELKELKIDELSQTLELEVPDSIKAHMRIQSSLSMVNKRLEEEIAKLRALLAEQAAKALKQNELIDHLRTCQAEANKLLAKHFTAKQHLSTIPT